MYLHLGQDCVVREKDIIGIFDLDNSSYSKITREFLSRSEREGEARYIIGDLPKAFVVTAEGVKNSVFLTQLSSQTLFKRAADEEFI